MPPSVQRFCRIAVDRADDGKFFCIRGGSAVEPHHRLLCVQKQLRVNVLLGDIACAAGADQLLQGAALTGNADDLCEELLRAERLKQRFVAKLRQKRRCEQACFQNDLKRPAGRVDEIGLGVALVFFRDDAEGDGMETAAQGADGNGSAACRTGQRL